MTNASSGVAKSGVAKSEAAKDSLIAELLKPDVDAPVRASEIGRFFITAVDDNNGFTNLPTRIVLAPANEVTED